MKKHIFRRPLLASLLLIAGNQAGNFIPPGGGTPPEPGAGGGGDETVYPEGFDDTLKGNETLLKHYNKETKTFNTNNMMKSLVHATGAMGKDKMNVPDKTWDADKWKDTMRSLGVPDTVEKYELQNNIPEGLKANDAFFDKFKGQAHELGILPHQAQHMLDWYNTTVGDQTKESNMLNQQSYDADKKIIKDLYGEATERKMAVAQAGIEAFAQPEAIARMTERGLLDNPDFVQFMVAIGEGIGEDKFNDEVKKKGAMTLAEIETELAAFYKPDHPYSVPRHPKKAHYETEFLRLQALKLSAKGIQNKPLM